MSRISRSALAIRKGSIVSVLLLAAGAANSASAQETSQRTGWADMQLRLGAHCPRGSGVAVCLVEASIDINPVNYGPDLASNEYIGKTFTLLSGPTGTSVHAQHVARRFFGNASSISPGISNIYVYWSGPWLSDAQLLIGEGSGSPPLPTPFGVKIYNLSFGFVSANHEREIDVAHRTDFLVNRDEVLLVTGVPNGIQLPTPGMYGGFNVISVGLCNGTHNSHLTLPLPGWEVPGRIKPDIVAPEDATSFSTPLVSGAAAVLVETARNWQIFTTPIATATAQRVEVLKSVILCGATKSPTWSNHPATSGADRGVTASPIDPKYGVGTLNINNSHLILTGLEQDGATTVPTAPNISYRGWDYVETNISVDKRYYRFHVDHYDSKACIVATWNRYVAPDFESYHLHDFDLQLWKVKGANNKLVSLVGNKGLGVFGGGNVVSASRIDNIEHLYVTGLTPGDYVLELARKDSIALGWDVAVAWLLSKPGDVNHDGVVNDDDLLAVIAGWGVCEYSDSCPPDQNANGEVNLDDLLMVVENLE